MQRNGEVEFVVMYWHMCRLTGVATAGRANSVMNASSILDVFMGPATCPGSATVRGTGVACCAIKVCQRYFFIFFTLILSHYLPDECPRPHPAHSFRLQLHAIDE